MKKFALVVLVLAMSFSVFADQVSRTFGLYAIYYDAQHKPIKVDAYTLEYAGNGLHTYTRIFGFPTLNGVAPRGFNTIDVSIQYAPVQVEGYKVVLQWDGNMKTEYQMLFTGDANNTTFVSMRGKKWGYDVEFMLEIDTPATALPVE